MVFSKGLMTKSQGFMITLDLTNTVEDNIESMNKWVKIVAEYKDTPKVVVGCKCDVKRGVEQLKEHAHTLGMRYVETSAKDTF